MDNNIEPPTSKRSPLVNTFIIIALIFGVGLMAYNFIGNKLTTVASQSIAPASSIPTPTITAIPTEPQHEE